MFNKMKKVGLVLEGGANRGVFTAGVLDCLRRYNLYVPYVVSVSVGTCNAMDYVSKQIGRTKECMIPNGRNIPPINWRNIPKHKSLVNLDMVFDEYPNAMIPFDYRTYFASEIESEYVVTNCHTGEAEYLSEKQDRKRLMNIGRASCSMPYLCKMVQIDNRLYLDGGIADAIPLRHAIEKGYKKNIIVLTRGQGYVKKSSKVQNFLSRMMYQQYPNLMNMLDSRAERYNHTMRYIDQLEKERKVIVIRPQNVLIEGMGNNFERMNSFYQQGYEVAEHFLEQIQNFICS